MSGCNDDLPFISASRDFLAQYYPGTLNLEIGVDEVPFGDGGSLLEGASASVSHAHTCLG
jgi:hypothetical protein